MTDLQHIQTELYILEILNFPKERFLYLIPYLPNKIYLKTSHHIKPPVCHLPYIVGLHSLYFHNILPFHTHSIYYLHFY